MSAAPPSQRLLHRPDPRDTRNKMTTPLPRAAGAPPPELWKNTPKTFPRGVPPPELWQNIDKSTLPDFLRDFVPPHSRVREYNPGDDLDLESASCGGHGTLEMLEVSRLLEENGILCAFCGVSALIYYGACRVRDV